MKKAEIEPYIGKPVRVWTALNGEYIGELVEVFGRPWRGKVRILAVVSYPTLGLRDGGKGFLARKPFAYNEIRDFGNSSVEPYTGVIPHYSESLIAAMVNYRQFLYDFFERTEEKGQWHKGDASVSNIYRQALEVLEIRLKEMGI